MKYIDLSFKKDYLILAFDWSEKTLEVIRTVPGRQYDAQNKVWLIPVENTVEACAILQPEGFKLVEEVQHLLDAKRASYAVLEAIKNSEPEDLAYFKDFPLFSFQKKGAHFLYASPASLLADVPGLGKTIQTIAALKNIEPILVLCPASLKYSWQEEIKKWEKSMSAQVITGKPEERGARWIGANQYKWTIANYELLLRDYEYILKIPWQAIVCDEATRISNPYAKSVKALKTIPCKKRIALTGTPISNTPIDIYSIIDWLSPKFFGSFNQFKSKYCLTEPRFNSIIGYRNLGQLGDLIQKFILRRSKEEVFDDFPKKTIQDIIFELSDKEREFYQEIKEALIKELFGIKFSPQTIKLAPVKMLRLKQCTGHPQLLKEADIESSKLEILKEMLKPIVSSGDKALIFTQFAQMAKILFVELSLYNPQLIIGEVSAEDRQKAVKEFTDNPEAKVMIMTEAGAYGLNLQAASYVFHFDFPWSVAKLTQREDRCHRIGQKKAVTVYNLIAKKSIDEYCVKVLYKKQKLSINLLKDEERLEEAGLSEEDIKTILRI